MGWDKILNDAVDWLPDLYTLNDAAGVWNVYVEQTYAIFCRDFVDSQPRFRGCWVRCRRDPIDEDGMVAGYWHCTSEGPEENNRTPALRRCERIAWARAVIEHSTESCVDIWENERHGKPRTLLWYNEDYLVILANKTRQHDGFKYYILTSAYDTTQEHRKRDLRRERAEFRKRQTPPPD